MLVLYVGIVVGDEMSDTESICGLFLFINLCAKLLCVGYNPTWVTLHNILVLGNSLIFGLWIIKRLKQ